MNEKPDAEEYARIILFHLASLRSEMALTKRTVEEILAHQIGSTEEQFQSRILDQEQKMVSERDRIYRDMLVAAKIPETPSEPPQDSGTQNRIE